VAKTGSEAHVIYRWLSNDNSFLIEASFSVYVVLTNMPEGELLTGFGPRN